MQGAYRSKSRSSFTNPAEVLRSLAKEMRVDTLYQRDDRMYAHCVRSEQVSMILVEGVYMRLMTERSRASLEVTMAGRHTVRYLIKTAV